MSQEEILTTMPELGFETKVDFKEGLTRTIEWIRQNLSLIESCIKKHERHLPEDLRAVLLGESSPVAS